MNETLQAVCPACGAVNRVDAARLGQGPVCGKCRGGLAAGQPVEVDEAGFNRFVSKSGLPVLVDFYAPWCGPCKMMAPQLAKAAAGLSPRAVVLKVDTERSPAVGARYRIQSVPTLALFKDGVEVDRISGAMNAEDIASWVRSRTRAV